MGTCQAYSPKTYRDKCVFFLICRQTDRQTKCIQGGGGGLKGAKLRNPWMSVLEKYVMHLYTSMNHV